MIALCSRVLSAEVTVAGAAGGRQVVGALDGAGLLVLVGVHRGDGAEQAATVVRKVAELRVLAGEESVLTAGAGVLVVSQFTLCGDTSRGRRPSWAAAAPPAQARVLVEAVVDGLRARGVEVATGRFGADMQVSSVGDGPFTVLVHA
ncbi:MAG: D-aminoacyl-tRNA deacylase [Mycobacteriaceae bacterium]